ncbi:hypothetical protein EH223_10335 [candidate division KSB1 bacterium]|nr:hypothetical protein [candidate division KSB1 bacterium]RQW03278.1 MAG: hypothetical protein EH223_10335 [candidate division KSB1 bacterium]
MQQRYLWLAIVLISVLIYFACSEDKSVSPKALENVGEKVFGAISIEQQKHLYVKNDSGGVYIYGYPDQDVIETLLYRTVSAESKKLAEQRLADIELKHDKADDLINIFTTVNTQPGRLRYTSWYSLEIPNKMVLDIHDVWEDINVFDLDTTLMVRDAGHNVSIVRHSGSAQVNTLTGDIYMEIAVPDSGYCVGHTGAGDIVVHLPQETSATIKLVTQDGLISVNNLEVKNEVATPSSFEGLLGLGEGEIILETGRGSIILQGF